MILFSMFGFPTGDLHPIYNAPMLGAHNSEHSTEWAGAHSASVLDVMKMNLAIMVLSIYTFLWCGCIKNEVPPAESETTVNDVMFEKIKESKEAYIAEFRKTSDLERQKELIFQFLVDMCQVGFEPSSSIQILVTGDDAVFKHPAVFQKLHSQCIDYVKELNVLDIYEEAGVPITRDFPDYKPDES